jgi:hypothetical protein
MPKKDKTTEAEVKAPEAETVETSAAPPIEAWKAQWDERLGKFATAVGKPVEDIAKALAGVVGDPSSQALDALNNEEAATFDDIKFALAELKVPIAILRNSITLLRGPKVEKKAVIDTTTSNPSLDILPTVPDDQAFLESLKVGGVLKVGQTEVISACRAGLADRTGFFDLPDILRRKMEEFAETQDEPVGEDYFKLHYLITRRRYADVFAALGISGQFMTEGRKSKFLQKLDENLWESLLGFNNQLQAWQDSWMKGAGNPAMMMTAMAAFMGGGKLPPGMIAPPDTAVLRDSAEGVIDKINHVFAGFGIPIARALAYDAQCIKNVLDDAGLPLKVGATNKEQMLKMLGLAVSADNVRLERNVVRFALAVMEYPKIESGQSEMTFLGALIQLGLSIPWDKLTKGANRPRVSKEKEEEFQRY